MVSVIISLCIGGLLLPPLMGNPRLALVPIKVHKRDPGR